MAALGRTPFCLVPLSDQLKPPLLDAQVALVALVALVAHVAPPGGSPDPMCGHHDRICPISQFSSAPRPEMCAASFYQLTQGRTMVWHFCGVRFIPE